MPDVTATVADRSGNTASAVASYTIGGSGQLPAGVRAAPGTVGYLSGGLNVINPGDTPPPGMAWEDSSYLRPTVDNLVLSGYQFNVGIYAASSKNNFTFKKCKFAYPEISYGIIHDRQASVLRLEDCTFAKQQPSTPATANTRMQTIIFNEGFLEAIRCDFSMGGDQIHTNLRPRFDSNGNLIPGTFISQCYVHKCAKVDPDQHVDAIQLYNVGGLARVEYNYVDPKGGAPDTASGPDYTYNTINSAMTCGTENLADLLSKVEIHGNYFGGGQHALRINKRLDSIKVTNNDCLVSEEAWELNPRIDVDETSYGAVQQWSGNRVVSRAGANLGTIPQPS